MFFTCWIPVSYIGILSNWSLKIQNEMLPPLWVWIGLDCIFSLWDTSEVDSKGKKIEKWRGILSDQSLKIQNGMPLTFEYELSWTAFLASGTPQEWISGEKEIENSPSETPTSPLLEDPGYGPIGLVCLLCLHFWKSSVRKLKNTDELL